MTLCDYYGHTWVQEGWSTSTIPEEVVYGPPRCVNCGAIQVFKEEGGQASEV